MKVTQPGADVIRVTGYATELLVTFDDHDVRFGLAVTNGRRRGQPGRAATYYRDVHSHPSNPHNVRTSARQ